ncbi:hypothetical protein OAE48_02825 [Flavobacteriales bacterium]|nr:hypothetical protein [Flavobacteriales bacterium]
MIRKRIKHIGQIKNWEVINENVTKPITLVLGSFNPYDENLASIPEFYYCRIPNRGRGNQFWPSIARNLQLSEDLRVDEQSRLEIMAKHKFIFLDLIDELVVESENEKDIEKFINDKIIKGFSDSVVWAKQTSGVAVSRSYNHRIVKLIEETESITRIVNTLGTGRGNLNFNQNEADWQTFKADLCEVCRKTNSTNLILDSRSPSPQGVGDDQIGFDRWVRNNILNIA